MRYLIIFMFVFLPAAQAGSWDVLLNRFEYSADTAEVNEDSGGGTLTWGISKVEFIPQPNITTYELAIVVKCFIENNNYCDSPPKEVEKHFKETIICSSAEECEGMGY